jgi:hypothetical protein
MMLYAVGAVMVLWFAVGVIGFRTLRWLSHRWRYLGPMQREDERFYAGLMFVFGPLAILAVTVTILCDWVNVRGLYRRVMGLD